jgi:hypothetical protein
MLPLQHDEAHSSISELASYHQTCDARANHNHVTTSWQRTRAAHGLVEASLGMTRLLNDCIVGTRAERLMRLCPIDDVCCSCADRRCTILPAIVRCGNII